MIVTSQLNKLYKLDSDYGFVLYQLVICILTAIFMGYKKTPFMSIFFIHFILIIMYINQIDIIINSKTIKYILSILITIIFFIMICAKGLLLKFILILYNLIFILILGVSIYIVNQSNLFLLLMLIVLYSTYGAYNIHNAILFIIGTNQNETNIFSIHIYEFILIVLLLILYLCA